jgi:hypothetical protein
VVQDSAIRALKAFLDKQGVGPIADELQLKSLLEACWHQFKGCAETEMHAGKLDRIEDATWQPPYLDLIIERHGAVVPGSKYANLQRWRLDLEALTAEVNEEGRRLIAPLDKAVDTKAEAESLVKAILSGQPDDRFKILPDGSVRLNISAIIPATNAETTSKRRKRLRRDLSALLEPHGWREISPRVYSKEKPTS